MSQSDRGDAESDIITSNEANGDTEGTKEGSNVNCDDSPLAQSLFLQHLSTYPAVSAVTGFAASFPVVKVFASNAVPFLQSIQNRTQTVTKPVSKRATPVLLRADRLGDRVLTTIDKRIPFRSQESSSSDSDTKPSGAQSGTKIGSAIETPKIGSDDDSGGTAEATGALQNYIVLPVRAAVKSAREQANALTSNTYNFTRTQVNRVVVPVNGRLEAVLTDYLPKENEELPIKDVKSETYKSVILTTVLLRRIGPAVAQQAATAAQLPSVANAHLRELYKEEKKKSTVEGSNRILVSVRAAVGTGRELTVEGGQVVSNGLKTKVQLFWTPGRVILTRVENNVNDPTTSSVTKPVYRKIHYVLRAVVPKSQFDTETEQTSE